MIDKFNTKHPKLLNLITKPLTKKTSPKILLAFSLLFSMHACYFYATNETYLAAAAVTLSSYSALLARETSKKHQKNLSTHLTRTADRIRDTFIFTGIALSQHIPIILGFITLASVVFLPHIAAHAQTLAKTKINPLISRGDIAIILIASTIATPHIKSALICALIIITALTTYSFAHTLKYILKTRRNTPLRQKSNTAKTKQNEKNINTNQIQTRAGRGSMIVSQPTHKGDFHKLSSKNRG